VNSVLLKLMAEHMFSEETKQKVVQKLNENVDIPIISEATEEKIIEALWKIIYSNQNADIYETNLMRRLAGLLYVDSKTMGDIKEKIKKEYSK